MVSKDDIENAAVRVSPHVRETPTVRLAKGTFGLPYAIEAKLEMLQYTGSFKPRGAFNRILTASPGKVIAASGGNHGLAVAYAARSLSIEAEVFLPTTAPSVKVARLRSLGANVTQVGSSYSEALAASRDRAKVSGAVEIHAYDENSVVAGQGTVGRELEEQVGGLDTVIVAVGGGGLIGGISSWFDGRVQVVAVEPEGAATLHQALRASRPVDVDVSSIAADSLGAKRIGSVGFRACQRTNVQSVLVSDAGIAAARQAIWDELRLAVEYGGATALAALQGGAYKPEAGERVAIVVCGANTDPADLVTRH